MLPSRSLGITLLLIAVPAQAQRQVGAGSYATALPPGAHGPEDGAGAPAMPCVTSNVSGPIPTNQWWSSLAWPRHGNVYSETLCAHPFSARALPDGIGLCYADQPTVTASEYHYPYVEDLRLGIEGLLAPRTEVDAYSDWTVTALWRADGRTLRVTLGHGFPFVWAECQGGLATVKAAAGAQIWYQRQNVVGISVRGHHYGLYCSVGATWLLRPSGLRVAFTGTGYVTVAALPDATTSSLQQLEQFAHAVPTGTRVSWSYDETSARLTTSYDVTTQARGGPGSTTLMGLYRHQWLHTSDPLLGISYHSPRGDIKLLAGNHFSTSLAVTGVLPGLPGVADAGSGYTPALLELYLDEVRGRSADELVPPGLDTYWTGKHLGKVAELVEIAAQLGDTALRDRLLAVLKLRLEDWLRADGGETTELFYYEPRWGTMIGYPAAYGSDTELNDHHFHYGYFVRAAATLARFDPGWAGAGAFGGMVELLIHDVANPVRNDPMLPFLRNMDVYAGHGWASGHAAFTAGNNEESCSEALNLATGIWLWGAETGDTGLRDLGVYLHATTVSAFEQYWWDTADAVFPAAFSEDAIAILWGDGGAYATWWTQNPEEIHGIELLPVTGGSLYLGRDPAYVRKNYQNLLRNNGGPPVEWRDVIWSFLAFADPATALAQMAASFGYTPEPGTTAAHTYQWVHDLAKLGQLDPSVTADVSTHAVFDASGTKTHVAYNPDALQRRVRFSDGAVLVVPPKTIASDAGAVPPLPPAPLPAAIDTVFVRDGAATGQPGPLALAAGSRADDDLLLGAGGGSHVGVPTNPAIYDLRGLTGVWQGGGSRFELLLDALSSPGVTVQAQLGYDFDGDGTFDRVETWQPLALDAVPGWQSYRDTAGLAASSGSFRDLTGGAVQLRVWCATGTGSALLRTDASSLEGRQSRLQLPFTIAAAVSSPVRHRPSAAVLDTDGPVPIGRPLTIQLDSALPNAPLLVLFDLRLGPTPLGRYAPSALGWTPALLAFGTATDGSGRWRLSDPLLSRPWLIDLYLEAYVVDPAAPNGLFWASNPLHLGIR